MTRTQKKAELIEEIIIILNWAHVNRDYHENVSKALGDVIWYESNELMRRVLKRISIANLTIIRDNVVEAIY